MKTKIQTKLDEILDNAPPALKDHVEWRPIGDDLYLMGKNSDDGNSFEMVRYVRDVVRVLSSTFGFFPQEIFHGEIKPYIPEWQPAIFVHNFWELAEEHLEEQENA